MKIKHINIATLLFSLALFASCSSEIAESVSSQGSVLQVKTDIANTRAIITGTTFSKGDSIGVCVLNAAGNLYTANSLNMPATYDGTQWKFESPLKLTTDAATVFAYYPYRSGVSSSLTVDITPNATTGQPDFLYAKPTSAVNADNPVATLHFNHLLSRITFQIAKSSADTGTGALTSISLGNSTDATVIATQGTADIKTFTIVPTANTAAKIKQTVNNTLSTTAVNIDLLVIPTTINNNAELTLVIDGKEYTVKIPSITWTAGKQYTYPVTVNRTSSTTVSLSIDQPDINPWNNNTGSSTTITNDNVEKITSDTTAVGGTVGNMVDLGLSGKWADHNVGATNPEDYGAYFAWGETETKSDYSESTSKWNNVSCSSLQSQGVIDSNSNLTATYDAATVNWGGNWRMPTKAEQDELRTKCTCTWTTSNGVSGYKVVGPNGNSIFLPAAGDRNGSGLYLVGSLGYCWSSTAYDYGAYLMYFSSYGCGWNGSLRRDGYSVRPVSE